MRRERKRIDANLLPVASPNGNNDAGEHGHAENDSCDPSRFNEGKSS